MAQVVRLPRQIDSAGVEITHTGAPGAVVAHGVSVDRTANMCFDVLLKDPDALPTNRFAFPWRLTGQTRSLVQTIQWDPVNVSGNVKIELSRNRGLSYETVTSSTANTGVYNWPVTGPTTSQALIKITSVTNAAVRDTSNAYFTISPASSITVTKPDGGEDWLTESGQLIQWSSVNVSGNVKIEVSRDGGSTFETVISSTANTGTYNWTVTGPATSQAVIKITSVTNAAARDTSNASFTIVTLPPPVITSVSPGVAPAEPGQPWMSEVNEGATTVLTVTGTNLNGMSVSVPRSNEDNPTACYPTALIVGGDPAGTRLDVQITLPSGPCLAPYYILLIGAADNSVSAFLVLETVFTSLTITTCSPTVVQPGLIHIVNITGFHLQGATLTPGPGLQVVSDVQVTDNTLTALVEALPEESAGTTTLTVSGPAGSDTVTLTVELAKAKQSIECYVIPVNGTSVTVCWEVPAYQPSLWPYVTFPCNLVLSVAHHDFVHPVFGCPDYNPTCLSAAGTQTPFMGGAIGGAIDVTVEVRFACLLTPAGPVPASVPDNVCARVVGQVGVIRGPGWQLNVQACVTNPTQPQITVGGTVDTMAAVGDGACVTVTTPGCLSNCTGQLSGQLQVCCNGHISLQGSGTNPRGFPFNFTTSPSPPPPTPVFVAPGTTCQQLQVAISSFAAVAKDGETMVSVTVSGGSVDLKFEPVGQSSMGQAVFVVGSTEQPTVTLSQSQPVTIRGKAVSSNVDDIQIVARPAGQPSANPLAQEPFSVVAIQKVEWIATTSPLDPNTHPTAPLGQRMFPEQVGLVLQNAVNVRATITPAVPGVMVFFRSIDVDDPSANMTPVDDETKTQDNRACAAPNCQVPNAINDGKFVVSVSNEESSATPVSAGVARAEALFEVTMQPGDNFRVVATCISQAAITGSQVQAQQNDGTMARVKDAMGNFISSDLTTAAVVKASDVLTLWRRLHVEVDSMEPIPAHPDPETNVVKGTITGIQGTATLATRVDVNQNLDDGSARLDNTTNMGNGRFETGTTTIGTGTGARQTANLRGNGMNYVETPTGSGFNIPY